MDRSRQIVYRYEGKPEDDEVVLDVEANEAIPKKGAVISRKGKAWMVDLVSTKFSLGKDSPLPVLTIFLTKHR